MTSALILDPSIDAPSLKRTAHIDAMRTAHCVTLFHRTSLCALMALALSALGGCTTYNGILNATGHLSRAAPVRFGAKSHFFRDVMPALRNL